MKLLLAQATATHLPLADESVQCCVTSPPYWALRSYAGEQRQVWGGEPEHAVQNAGCAALAALGRRICRAAVLCWRYPLTHHHAKDSVSGYHHSRRLLCAPPKAEGNARRNKRPDGLGDEHGFAAHASPDSVHSSFSNSTSSVWK